MKNRGIISDSKDCEKIKAAVVLMTVEERMMEQRTITVQRISEKESDVFGWMKYLEE